MRVTFVLVIRFIFDIENEDNLYIVVQYLKMTLGIENEGNLSACDSFYFRHRE